MNIEPLSTKNIGGFLNVSLRGIFAEIASNLKNDDERSSFAQALLKSTHPDVERVFNGDALVIGLSIERGRYFPDW